MIPPFLVRDFDRIADRVANPHSLLASLDTSDDDLASLIRNVARRAHLPAASVAAVFDACIESADQLPTHDDAFDGFAW